MRVPFLRREEFLVLYFNLKQERHSLARSFFNLKQERYSLVKSFLKKSV